ncbi:class I histocompatibility antigen, F10 alpha chain-like isoform 3-T3 [Menidia menidia]
MLKLQIFLFLLGMRGSAAVTHSMTYIVTTATGLKEFPEHNEVGLLDGEEFVHYDSNLKRIIPKTAWIQENTDADYWERETQRNINTQETFKANVRIVMQRFNQTGGVHIVQRMYGCEWDEDAGEVRGYDQFGYDGEDFIALDLKNGQWIAPKHEAVITKNKWDSNKAFIEQEKNYLHQICPDWLKKYVNYGSSVLRRTERPSVSLLQRTPSSPVSCHATGFYPSSAELLWRKDGEEVHEGVTKGEILPNNDGTFQMSADLDVSSVPAEDWTKYECVFQLSNTKDLPTRLEKGIIKTNAGSNVAMVIGIIVAAAFLLVIAVIGFILYRKKDAKRPPSPVENAEVQEQMIPKA